MEYTPYERAHHTYEILDTISPSNITFLNQTDPFRLLVSVILSAQTTDRQVNEVASVLFEKYPSVESLAHADIDSVKEIIRSTGYFNAKAKNIIGTAKALLEKYGGVVPFSMEELVKLPGVGRKTASVIIGQLDNQPAIIVDTHFARVVRRLGLTVATDPERIEREVAKLLPPANHYRYSMIVNLHGRQVCHARKPQCGLCQLAPYCKSYPIQ
ncbi:endonuclease III [Pleomorphochaeta sp. DL1XJH-081]|uniref:endonuclease III n=1 Tax=Pleomorphochaeta sp. DL1XJH-081 TaxID=3409690 RepID=UPI003BB625F9